MWDKLHNEWWMAQVYAFSNATESGGQSDGAEIPHTENVKTTAGPEHLFISPIELEVEGFLSFVKYFCSPHFLLRVQMGFSSKMVVYISCRTRFLFLAALTHSNFDMIVRYARIL